MSEGHEPEARVEGAEGLRVADSEPPAGRRRGTAGAPRRPLSRSPSTRRASSRIPDGVGVFAGSPNGARRSVGIVVARFNGDITTRLLDGALEALDEGRRRPGPASTSCQVPGAFELPLGAMALARTRRYACVVALGCRDPRRHAALRVRRRGGGERHPARRVSRPASRSPSASSPATRASRPRRGRAARTGTRAPRRPARRSRWPTSSARLRSDAVTADRR